MTKILDILLPYQKSFFQNTKKRKIWISGRQLGKSTCIAGILVYRALSKPNGLSICISTGARAASEIIRKCAQFAEAVKQLTNNSIDYTQSFDKIAFSNGCRVISLPASDDGANLRGFSANCVVIDESAFVSHLEEQLNAIAPTLTRDPDAELVFTTTPAGTNGFFYKLYQDALNNPDWYVQHTTIHDAINDGLKVDLDSLHSLCPDPDVFAQEYECKFMSEYSSFIDTSLIDFTDNIPQGRHFLGMDVGSKHDRSAIVDIIEKDQHIYIDDIQILDKASYTEQQAKAETLYSKSQPFGYVDSNGIGSALAEYINKKCPKIKGFSTTSANKTSLYEYLRAKIFEHKFHVRKKFQSTIITDFNNVSRIVSEDGKVHYSAEHNANGHSDVTSAIVLGMQAEREHPASIAMPVSYRNSSALGSLRSRI